MQIKNFEELVKPALKIGQQYVSHDCKKLLSAGENYGSIMLQVEVKILNENNEEETIHCVAKTCPPTAFLWEIFNTKVTFKIEIAVYNILVPTLNEFGKEKGVECLLSFFAKTLGARISLDPESDEVDENAVLLLENLKVKGYDVVDRFIGFDMESAKLVLNDLAVLHGAMIAYKLQKPEEFQRKIRPILKKSFNPPDFDKFADRAIKTMQSAAASNPECVPYLPKIEKAVRNMKNIMENPPKVNELFATMSHNDYWVNNTMLKFKNGKPFKNKMVDFQIIGYNSLAHDVIFFLYTSVQLSVLENNIDELIKFYYGKFIDILVKLECNAVQYTFEAIMSEFAYIAEEEEFAHILFMLAPILTLKEKVKDLDNLQVDDMGTDEGALHENYSKRIQFILLDFVKREWI